MPAVAVILAMGLLFLFGPVGSAQPQFRNAGATLIAETTANKVIESGERITVSLALKNVGDQPASNLVAILRPHIALSALVPSAQSYGLLAPGGPSVAREFEFTANAPSDSLVFVNLDLADSDRHLGTVTFRFRIGPHIALALNLTPVVINDQNTATAYPSVISISNVPGSIINVSVTLSGLSHTFPDDLDVLLLGPSGDSVLLMSDACGTSDFDQLTLTFTDQTANVLPNQGWPSWTTVRPTNYAEGDLFPAPAPAGPYLNALSAFNSKSPNGPWQLFLLDDSLGDSGLLANGWSLNITTIQEMDATPMLLISGPTTNNTIRLTVSGRPYHSYAIETAPDLMRSTPMKTFIMSASGWETFEVPLEPVNRFFHASTDP